MAQLRVGRDIDRAQTRPNTVRGDKAQSSRGVHGDIRSRGIKAVAPTVRSGHVRLGDEAWHGVIVLKFVHARFVLERPDLAVYLRELSPALFRQAGPDEVQRLSKSRAIVDCIASFTDAQAVSLNALPTGTADNLWEAGRGL